MIDLDEEMDPEVKKLLGTYPTLAEFVRKHDLRLDLPCTPECLQAYDVGAGTVGVQCTTCGAAMICETIEYKMLEALIDLGLATVEEVYPLPMKKKKRAKC